MKNRLTDQPSDLDGFGVCEVCGEAANTLTYDLKVTRRIDEDFPSADAPQARIARRFCTLHRRGGTVAVVTESQEAYFARVQATEGDEL